MQRAKLIYFFMAIVIMILIPLRIYADDEKEENVTAYVLMEMSTGTVVSENNAHEAVPVGTMAKLMTVLIAAEKIASGELSLDDTVTASAAANSMQGAQIWLMLGEKMLVSDLLKGVIIGNANDASVAIAEAVAETEEGFVELMNDKATELGMLETSFTNCNGFYNDDQQFSSAYDMAVLSRELYKYDFLREYFTCWMDYLRDGATEIVNSNTLVRNYDGIVGFKAGFSENVGNCIAVAAERDGAAYAAVILGYDDKDNMFYNAKQLLNRGFSEYQVYKPNLPEEIPTIIEVKGGYAKEIPLQFGDVRNMVIPNGTVNDITSKYFIPKYIYAPVEIGDKVGEIHFYQNERFIFSVDVLADGVAEKINVKKSLVILLKFLMSF